MIEVAAKALHNYRMKKYSDVLSCEELPISLQTKLREEVRAVIESIKKPSLTMIDVGMEVAITGEGSADQQVEAIFIAMVKSLLEDEH